LVPVEGELRIEIKGELAGILELCDAHANQKPGGPSTAGLAEQIKMVAGGKPPTVDSSTRRRLSLPRRGSKSGERYQGCCGLFPARVPRLPRPESARSSPRSGGSSVVMCRPCSSRAAPRRRSADAVCRFLARPRAPRLRARAIGY
jgi:hypothetical protein